MAIPVAVSSIDVLWAYGAFEGIIPVFGEGEAPRHLVLTGPNGTGKSSILRGLSDALVKSSALARNWRYYEKDLAQLREKLESTQDTSIHATLQAQLRGREHEIQGLKMQPVIEASVHGAMDENVFILHLPASRRFEPNRVKGPARLTFPPPRGADDLSRYFLQYLVNRRSEQAFAREDNDDEVADGIQRWFDELVTWLRQLLQQPTLELRFDRRRYSFDLEFDDHQTTLGSTLPDGFSSILRIWSEILIACAALEGKGEIHGFVLIDEPEVHLHPELQETLLPLLTQQFPTLQFIIATHSPIVMLSLANATIYDLASKQASRSEEWQGIRYGNVLKTHFGGDADFDEETQARLARLHELHQLEHRTLEQTDEIRDIARPLAIRGHLYALRVMTELGDD